ncbi:MAG TPA: YwmB family TATA-box binding protein [Clostridia bacterium]|nr:YwmB family TATA-box binding protein [Clostridia bacterium]
MKKFAFALSIFILVISIFLLSIQKVQQEYSAADAMSRAFKATGASAVSCEIFIQCSLSSAELEKEEFRRELIKNIISGAGGDLSANKPVFNNIDNDISSGTITDYIINDDNAVHVSVLKDKHAENADLYRISSTFDNTSGPAGIPGVVNGLKRAFGHCCSDPDINISITGSLDGKLGDENLDQLYEKAFAAVDADKVEGIDEPGLISVSAFSPSIRDSVRVNGRRININMAARYNSYEGKTYIWLATPVITTEY